jgi:hypothetical protein
MIGKERENKHLTWLGIELSTSIPRGGANFDPGGFISTNVVDIHFPCQISSQVISKSLNA